MQRHVWKPTLPPKRKHKQKIFNELAKTGQFIYQIGESDSLRKPSKPVPLSAIRSGIFREKLGYLKQCLLKYREITSMGRGIAAVQVGIPEQFFLIFVSKEKRTMIIINPTITKTAQKRYRHNEICMSASPIDVSLVRPAWVEFTYYDEEGIKRQWRIKDGSYEEKSYNRVVQHEIDHLHGIINIDKVESKTLSFDFDTSLMRKTPYDEVKE